MLKKYSFERRRAHLIGVFFKVDSIVMVEGMQGLTENLNGIFWEIPRVLRYGWELDGLQLNPQPGWDGPQFILDRFTLGW